MHICLTLLLVCGLMIDSFKFIVIRFVGFCFICVCNGDCFALLMFWGCDLVVSGFRSFKLGCLFDLVLLAGWLYLWC